MTWPLAAATLDRARAAATDAARAAGAIALKYYTSRFDVTLKPDQTPVTQADREAEETIVATLGRAYPDWGFLGEEFGAKGATDIRWIIDSIDGTKNFVRRIPVWATLLALEAHGEIVAGVILNPVTGELYAARKGGGARLNGRRVSGSSIGDMWSATFLHAGLRLYRKAGVWDGVVRLVDATQRQRGFRDYLGYAPVADGQAAVYVPG